MLATIALMVWMMLGTRCSNAMPGSLKEAPCQEVLEVQSEQTLVDNMIADESKWAAFREFCHTVMVAKETAERIRRGEQQPVS
jgi:hypothetical protein